ncbi:hypothetical protein I317_01279 [Kwoniella heveanensis CBS 569]|nr:hypothetical protein I317_01279 [Kwoniella heveanensis CBS 569]
MPPKKSKPRTHPDLNAPTPAVRCSKRLAKLKLKSSPLCIPLYEFPPEITGWILSLISYNEECHQAQVFRLMMVDKRMYHTFSDQLYQTLDVNAKTAKSIFEGINHPVFEAKLIAQGQNHVQEAHNEDPHSASTHHLYETEQKQDKDQTNEQTEEDDGFGLDPLSIHNRKIALLKNTKRLFIRDWEGARAIAVAMGLDEEASRIVLSGGPTPVVAALALRLLLERWQLTDFSWHKIPFGAEMPDYPTTPPFLYMYLDDCPRSIRRLEIVNLTHPGTWLQDREGEEDPPEFMMPKRGCDEMVKTRWSERAS